MVHFAVQLKSYSLLVLPVWIVGSSRMCRTSSGLWPSSLTLLWWICRALLRIRRLLLLTMLGLIYSVQSFLNSAWDRIQSRSYLAQWLLQWRVSHCLLRLFRSRGVPFNFNIQITRKVSKYSTDEVEYGVCLCKAAEEQAWALATCAQVRVNNMYDLRTLRHKKV